MAGIKALSRYTTFVGVAVDRVNAVLSSNIIATATSLPVTYLNDTAGVLTAEGASYSAIILDGPLTEVVAVTGNLSGGAVACAATANAHSMFAYVAFQLTASIGPTIYMPLETFKPSDMYDQLLDTAAIGSRVTSRGAVPGKREATFEFGGAVFADTFGYVLGGVFGAEDYTSGTPSEHDFSVENGVNTSSGQVQPPRLLIYNYNAYNTRVFSGRISETTVTYDPKQLLKYSAKFMGRAGGVVSNPTSSFSAIKPLQTWYGYATIGGTNVGNILNAEVTVTNTEAENIPTMSGTQDPWDTFLGATEIKGKFALLFVDDTQNLNYENCSQPAVDWILSRTVSGVTQGVTVQMTDCDYTKADVVQQGKAYVTNDIEFEAIANTTDATTAGGGLSPAKVKLYNAVASGTTYT